MPAGIFFGSLVGGVRDWMGFEGICYAIHDYPETSKDIAWAKAVRAAVIAGHDYSDDFPGVIHAVDEAGGPRRLCRSLWAL